MGDLATIERQAQDLARSSREAEPNITDVLWFPDPEVVRLVGVDREAPPSMDGKVHPFRFRSSPQDGLPAVSDVAIVSPEEVGHAELPDGWSWDEAKRL